MARVAVGCPVRNRAWILPEYLAALKLLAIHGDDIQFCFLVNNSTDDSCKIIYEWMDENRVIGKLVKDDLWKGFERWGIKPFVPGHKRGEYGKNSYAYMAEVRNRFLEVFMETEADYLFSVDSDIIVNPGTLKALLGTAQRFACDCSGYCPGCPPKKDIVAAAISNINGFPYNDSVAANFMFDNSGALHHWKIENGVRQKHPTSGTFEVAVNGACVLIPRLAIELGVRYGPHPQGEDTDFCLNAKREGFKLWVNADTRPSHRMASPK